ncbi:MAG: DUF6049 family protein [Demequinaceae bacterium]|nr:DUF6049 family protein [Demequinaceae bacterium]
MSVTERRIGMRLLASGIIVATLLTTILLPASGTMPGVQQETITEGLSLNLTRLDPGVLMATDSLTVEATITNDGPSSVENLQLSMSVTTEPIEDRALLGPWERGDLELPSREVAQTPVNASSGIAAMSAGNARLSAQPAILAFPPDTFGVYGLTITLDGTDGPIKTIRTFVTWLDVEPSVVPVSIVVLASGSMERVDTLLDTVDRQEIAFAVDPMMLSPTATARLSILDAYLLPAYNVDLASLARAGRSSILDQALTQARLAVPSYLASAPWLAVAPNVDQAVFTLASDRTASAILSMPVFSTDTPSPSGYSGGIPPSSAMLEGSESSIPILLPDAQLSAALVAGPPGSVTTPARVTAETALLSLANDAGNPVLAVAGPSWSIEPDHHSATLTALVESPWVRLTRIATVLEHDPPASVSLPSSSPSVTDIPVPLLTSAGSSLRGLDALAKTTSDPATFSDPLVASLLSALSFDRRTDPTARDDAIEATVATIDGIRAGVFLPRSSTLNLISKSGNVPVMVTNDLTVDVTVRVVLESRSHILVVEAHPEVTLAAGSSQQVLIPVTAVSSGNVEVRVSLTNVEGTRLTPVTEFSLRIRAQWVDLFTVAMVSFGLVLLIAGSLRTIRRGKADTRQGPSIYPDDEGDA